MRHDALLESRCVRDAGYETVDTWHVERFVDENIGTFGEPHEIVRRRSISGDDDRAVGCVETIGERWHDRRMPDQGRRHRYILVLHDLSAVSQLVHVNQRYERDPALVGYTSIDVIRIHLKKELSHPLKWRRPPGIDACAQSRLPSQQQQVAVVCVVIRMMMGDEDVP